MLERRLFRQDPTPTPPVDDDEKLDPRELTDGEFGDTTTTQSGVKTRFKLRLGR